MQAINLKKTVNVFYKSASNAQHLIKTKIHSDTNKVKIRNFSYIPIWKIKLF